MLFTESFLYVHTPKTAGMSLQSFLVENLKDEKIYVVTKSKEYDLNELKVFNRNIEHIHGGRHLDIEASLKLYKKIFSSNPKIILTVIREPAELVFSYYHHLLKPKVLKIRGMTKDNMWGHPKLAHEENFNEFALRPDCFYRLNDKDLMKYYDCEEDVKIKIVPLPFLNDFLSQFPYLKNNQSTLEKRNYSKKTNQIIKDQTKRIIYKNYPKYSAKYNESLIGYKENKSPFK